MTDVSILGAVIGAGKVAAGTIAPKPAKPPPEIIFPNIMKVTTPMAPKRNNPIKARTTICASVMPK